MRIDSATLSLTSQHAASRQQTRHESLTAGVGPGPWDPTRAQISRERTAEGDTPPRRNLLQDFLQTNAASPEALRAALDDVEAEMTPALSPLAVGGMAGLQTASLDGMDLLARIEALSSSPSLSAMQPLSAPADADGTLKMDLIRTAVEAFTGRALPMLRLDDLRLGGAARGDAAPQAGPAQAYSAQNTEAPGDAEAQPRFGLVYRRRETVVERETTSFEARGVVHTADGRRIDIDVSLTMDREMVSETTEELRAGVALEDPLVVNYAGTAADLTQRTFAFDLDTDGEAEQIHFTTAGSGFLAWDRDGSGAVENGAELFGPATGQGFAELAQHDDDGNGFIDEGDSIWSGLRIWEKDAQGRDSLVAVGDRGIGAIYLGSAATPFDVTDDEGALQGVVRRSGIFLREDGGAGTVQHVDLVV
jgi:hypothetical protein